MSAQSYRDQGYRWVSVLRESNHKVHFLEINITDIGTPRHATFCQLGYGVLGFTNAWRLIERIPGEVINIIGGLNEDFVVFKQAQDDSRFMRFARYYIVSAKDMEAL